MATTTDKALHDLVLINNERREGYQKAAEDVQDSALKALFLDFSQQSQQFASELKQHIGDSDDRPDYDDTSIPSKVHRTWIDIKSAITGQDREAILSSCEFGDGIAVNEYEQALKDEDNLQDSNLQSLLQRQKRAIEQGRARIKALQHSNN